MRLVIDEGRRALILEAAKDAAIQANQGHQPGYTTEMLIEVAVAAAIDKMETLLA